VVRVQETLDNQVNSFGKPMSERFGDTVIGYQRTRSRRTGEASDRFQFLGNDIHSGHAIYQRQVRLGRHVRQALQWARFDDDRVEMVAQTVRKSFGQKTVAVVVEGVANVSEDFHAHRDERVRAFEHAHQSVKAHTDFCG